MAGFKQHISVASIISTGLSTTVYTFHLVTQLELLMLFILCLFGTSLPDLDSNTSKPLKATYNFLSIIIPSLLLYYLVTLEMITNVENNMFVFLGIFLIFFLIFFCFFRMMMKKTKHRGVIHSLPMGVLFSLITISIAYYLNYPKNFILLSGLFVFVGFVVHLFLDELYSAVKMKKSFGSAFKFIAKDNLYGTLVTYILIFLFIYALPYKYSDYNYILELFVRFI